MKQISLKLPYAATQVLSEVVERYVVAAYPPGGSECAQSAREALQSCAQRLLNEYDPEKGSVSISRRIKAHLKSAVEYYPQTQGEHSHRADRQSRLLLKCLDGDTLSQEDWDS